MESVKQDIKNRQFKRIYLFKGEEGYLRNQYSETLKNALVNEDDTMNYSYFTGDNIDEAEIIGIGQTLPFLNEYRVVMISDSNVFKGSNDKLADFLKDVPQETIFIFSEENPDKRSKLYKAITSNGRVIDCAKPSEDVLKRWILSKIKKENKEITGQAMYEFLSRTGTDMLNISNELEKLICYMGNRNEITIDDVKDICSEVIEEKVFEMIDSMSMHSGAKAMKLYYDLLTNRVSPVKILTLITRQYNILFQVKELRERGADKETIRAGAGIPKFAVDKYISISSRYKRGELFRALKKCVASDRDFKTGKITDTLAVELLIVEFSSNTDL